MMIFVVVRMRGYYLVTIALGRRIAVIVVAVGALLTLRIFTTGD